jgi:hypothetical protein
MILVAVLFLAVVVSGVLPAVVLTRAGLPNQAVATRTLASIALSAAVVVAGWITLLYSCDAEITNVSAQLERRLCNNDVALLGMAALVFIPAVMLVRGALLSRRGLSGRASLMYLAACSSPILPVVYVRLLAW